MTRREFLPLVMEMQAECRSDHYGQGEPNPLGDIGPVQLPSSRIVVSYSMKQFVHASGDETDVGHDRRGMGLVESDTLQRKAGRPHSRSSQHLKLIFSQFSLSGV